MQVTIGHEFFKKVRLDYAKWQWACLRELLQNSIDAPGTTEITVRLTKQQGRTVLSFANNGSPMSEDIIQNKLFCLGASTKDLSGASGSVGGFGIAKSVIYLCHDSYVIRSGYNQVAGSGGEFQITQVDEFFPGTLSVITLEESEFGALADNLKILLACTQWDGIATVSIEGEPDVTFTPNLKKGSPRRTFPFGTVYTNKSFSKRLIVRINGIPMFIRHTPVDRCVILELTNSQVLTSNRDALSGNTRTEFEDFVTSLSVDSKSALKKNAATIIRYSGKQHGEEETPATTTFSVNLSGPVTGSTTAAKTLTAPNTTSGETEQSWSDVPQSPTTFELFIKNETGMVIPDYLLPESFSAYGTRLMTFWAKIMIKMHEITKTRKPFGVGFVFSEDSEAQHQILEGKDVYLLNPVTIVTQANSSSRSMKNRYKLTQRDDLIALAAHEFVHRECKYHDETYAGKLTDLMAVVLKNRQKFNSCFA